MEIDYWDKDFNSEDIEDVNDFGELAEMGVDLYYEIEKSKEKIEIYKNNLKIIEKRMRGIENENS